MMAEKNEHCPQCEHVHKKNLFKITRLKNLNAEQNQTIENHEKELKLLKQELKMSKKKLDRIIDVILPHGQIEK